MNTTILQMFDAQRQLISQSEVNIAVARENLEVAKENLDKMAATFGFLRTAPPDTFDGGDHAVNNVIG